MMKHTIICRSDADAQRTRPHTQHRAGRGSMTTLAGLILAALTVPAWSAVTASPTGPINGTVPFFKADEPERSRLYVADQDGNTVGTEPENSIVNMEHTPSSFQASTTETVDIFPDDLDGDCDTTGTPPRQACDVAVGATTNRVWKYNGGLLNDVMLSSPFKTYFAGKTLSVVVTAPVTTTSHTGVERVGTHPLSSDETLVYVPVVPGIYTGVYTGSNNVNNYYWAPARLFPTTAALGLQFTYYIGEGIQGNYNFATNQPSWTSVNAAGVVEFTAAPTSATKTVTLTATQIAAPHATQSYTFTVNKWFEPVRISAGTNLGSPISVGATSLCAAKGTGWRYARTVQDGRGIGPANSYRKIPGALNEEWGAQMATGWQGTSDGNKGMTILDQILPDSDILTLPSPFPQVVGNSIISIPYTGDTSGEGLNPDSYRKVNVWQNVYITVDLMCVLDVH
ncbi:TPA: hypothetical protein ACVBYD_000697 [Yersinia enterocolitica]